MKHVIIRISVHNAIAAIKCARDAKLGLSKQTVSL